MSLIKITNHVQAAQDRLVEQYKESVKFNDLIESFVLPVQEIEDQIDDVYRLRSINTAEGVQLDGIGSIVGQLRSGQSDTDYRASILAQIEINISGGQPESIINALRQILNPLVIDYTDIYPAYFQIFVQTDNFVPNLPSLIRSFSPAGVGNGILLQGSSEAPFVFSEVSTELANFVMQSGNFPDEEITELELVYSIGNNYNLEVVADSTLDDFTGDGFAEVYLNEAILLIDGDEYDIGDGTLLELDLSEANEDYTISDFGGELIEVIAI